VDAGFRNDSGEQRHSGSLHQTAFLGEPLVQRLAPEQSHYPAPPSETLTEVVLAITAELALRLAKAPLAVPPRGGAGSARASV